MELPKCKLICGVMEFYHLMQAVLQMVLHHWNDFIAIIFSFVIQSPSNEECNAFKLSFLLLFHLKIGFDRFSFGSLWISNPKSVEIPCICACTMQFVNNCYELLEHVIEMWFYMTKFIYFSVLRQRMPPDIFTLLLHTSYSSENVWRFNSVRF